jgi:hypothetical protein
MIRINVRYSLATLMLGILLHAGISTLKESSLADPLPNKRSALTLYKKVKKSSAPASSQTLTEEERAVALFKEKTKKFQDFLASKPVFLDKQDLSKSPTGFVYTHYRFKLNDINLNVKRSNSLISPFIGYIDLIYEIDANKQCGDIVDEKQQYSERYEWGYSTQEKAIAHAYDCFNPHRAGSLIFPPNEVQLIFAFQVGKWVFKDAIRTKHNNRDRLLLGALGRPEPGQYKLDDNQRWEALIK